MTLIHLPERSFIIFSEIRPDETIFGLDTSSLASPCKNNPWLLATHLKNFLFTKIAGSFKLKNVFIPRTFSVLLVRSCLLRFISHINSTC